MNAQRIQASHLDVAIDAELRQAEADRLLTMEQARDAARQRRNDRDEVEQPKAKPAGKTAPPKPKPRAQGAASRPRPQSSAQAVPPVPASPSPPQVPAPTTVALPPGSVIMSAEEMRSPGSFSINGRTGTAR